MRHAVGPPFAPPEAIFSAGNLVPLLSFLSTFGQGGRAPA
jgi:hypothetical protein